MSYIVEDATQTISKLCKLDKQTKTIFKPNYVHRIVSLSRNCNETSSKSKECANTSSIVKKFEIKLSEK